MKFCVKCGLSAEDDNQRFCMRCGTPFPSENNIGIQGSANQNEYRTPPNYNAHSQVSFRKFVNEIADPKIKKEMNSVGIIGYILAAINLIISIVSMNPNGIVDVVLIAGLSLGIHIGKSRICAILFLIYGAINLIVMTAHYGRPAGYWGLILGICAIREFYKAHKQYKNYISNKII